MSFNIEVDGGSSVRLPTAGKYCDRDIVITATGSGGAKPVIQQLSVTANGTYTALGGIDGYSPVSVNVPVPEGYIRPSGTLNITQNGEYDVTEKEEVLVAIPEPTLQTKTVTPAKSAQEVEADDGYAGLDKVLVEGIPAKYQDVTPVTTTAAKVLDGNIFVDSAGTPVEGTMRDNGAVSASVDESADYAITEGYHNGKGKVGLAASLLANIAAAFSAISSKGGTVPSSKVSGNLASAIASIPEGVTVQIKTGTATGVTGATVTVNCGFKPDVVLFTGTAPQMNNKAIHTGIAFTEENVTTMQAFFPPVSTSYVLSVLTVTQTASGFKMNAAKISTSGQQSAETSRNIPYIAIKYTE